MSDPRYHTRDEANDLPEDLRKEVSLLRGIRQLLKEIPSFPEGNLRTHLEERCQSLLGKATTSAEQVKELSARIASLSSENADLRSALDSGPCSKDVISTSNDSIVLYRTKWRWSIVCLFLGIVIGFTNGRYSILRDATIPEEKVVPSLKR